MIDLRCRLHCECLEYGEKKEGLQREGQGGQEVTSSDSKEVRKVERWRKGRSLKQRGAQRLTIPTQEVSAVLDHRDPPPHVHAPAVHIVQDHMKQVWRANHHLNQNPRLESEKERPTIERQLQSCSSKPPPTSTTAQHSSQCTQAAPIKTLDQSPQPSQRQNISMTHHSDILHSDILKFTHMHELEHFIRLYKIIITTTITF